MSALVRLFSSCSLHSWQTSARGREESHRSALLEGCQVACMVLSSHLFPEPVLALQHLPPKLRIEAI
jgi:hypothetical protein